MIIQPFLAFLSYSYFIMNVQGARSQKNTVSHILDGVHVMGDRSYQKVNISFFIHLYSSLLSNDIGSRRCIVNAQNLLNHLYSYIYAVILAGESIPIRLFLNPYELKTTLRNIDNKISVKYFLNLQN